ncbi:MAG: formylglycine-generating enzyme family protein [Planctomycetota bacterium]
MTEQATAPEQEATGPPPGMVQVPGGPFLFGRGKGRQVELGEFWIDATPVTNRAYLDYVNETRRPAPRHWPAQGPTDEMLDLPVVFVTYAEAEAYAEHLGQRLPTAAQFEKAARGTDGRKYPWGNTVRAKASNTRESGILRLTPVGAFPLGASPYGCHDMAGNVLHWTRALKKGNARTLKGGCFREFLGACCWTYEGEADKRLDHIGFRCVWTPSA